MLVLPWLSACSILYQRGIYPEESFKQKPYHGLQVHVSTDKELAKYLDTVMGQMQGAQAAADNNAHCRQHYQHGQQQAYAQDNQHAPWGATSTPGLPISCLKSRTAVEGCCHNGFQLHSVCLLPVRAPCMFMLLQHGWSLAHCSGW